MSGKKKKDLEPEVPPGTNSSHFALFLSNLMDTLDKMDKKGMYLVMDNAPIPKTEYIQALVTGRGYVPIFLPPYSPFLNPIEEFWAAMKHVFHWQELEKQETHESQLRNAGKAVGVEVVQGFIRNAYEQYFPRCKAMEEL